MERVTPNWQRGPHWAQGPSLVENPKVTRVISQCLPASLLKLSIKGKKSGLFCFQSPHHFLLLAFLSFPSCCKNNTAISSSCFLLEKTKQNKNWFEIRSFMLWEKKSLQAGSFVSMLSLLDALALRSGWSWIPMKTGLASSWS